MSWIELKLARDKTQASRVNLNVEAIQAVIEVDAKKTNLLVGDEGLTVHGSYEEVMAKVRGATG